MADSIDDLTTPLTREEVQAKIYTVLAAIGVDTTTWKPGSVVRSMITGVSAIAAAFSTLQALVARSGFLELAEDQWLDLVAWYVYGVKRDKGTFATGKVTLTNTAGGFFTMDPDDVVLRNVDTGKTYRNMDAFTLSPLSVLELSVRAEEIGTASNAVPGQITEFVTPLLGVLATNVNAVVGLDPESDPSLRARCSAKLGSLSPFGPWDAYSYAVRTAKRPDGSSIGVTGVRTTKDGYGNVTTYVATATGTVTGDPDDPLTDLGILNEAIQHNAAPLAVTAWTASAVGVTVAITYRVTMYNTSGLTQAQIEEAIAQKLIAHMSLQPIGGNIVSTPPGKLYRDALASVIASTFPQIFHVEIIDPAVDVSLAIDAIPMLGTLTAQAITQVPPSEGSP